MTRPDTRERRMDTGPRRSTSPPRTRSRRRRRSTSTSSRCGRVPAWPHPTSSPSSTRTRSRTPTGGSCTRRRCPTSATSSTTSAGTAARPPATGPDRSHLIIPGFRSSRIYVVNVADDPLRPQIEKVIEPDELVRATGYTRPHTTHCMPGENVVISMLGDADGNAAGGFAVIDAKTFEVKGRWENGGPRPPMNYDFWYQPRKNTLVSSEFGAPNAYEPGFDLADVEAGRYGQRLHFWNLERRELEQTIDLGANGLDPARDPLAARPRGRRGLRRGRALLQPSGASTARTAPTRPSR